MKLNKVIVIGIIIIILSLVFTWAASQSMPGLWYTDDTGIFTVEPLWHLGSNTLRIAKGWLTDADISGT